MNESKIEIVVIEDDIGISKAIRDNCRFRGYETRAAFDGATGLQILQERLPDLIVLDVMLPNLGGLELCSKVRALGVATPILILSAKNRESDIVAGLDAGADDYLVKPFGIEEFFARVKALLRRHSKEVSDAGAIEIDDVRFIPEANAIHVGEESIPLTPKESGLLKLLIENPNQPFTRSKLLQRIWNTIEDVSDRSVDRCVTTLRGKLGSCPALKNRIKTIRDIGYLFDQADQR